MERKIIVKDDGGKSKEMAGESEIVLIETEQDPMVLPHMSSDCLLSVENFGQRISLIREMRNANTKENSQRRPNNNTVVIKHRQGPLLPSQGL